ncbi:hypothetical protein Syun_004037 [Stephania yunnanensis]|uniref:Uncharacterized protein n=1 Tax=Stephania yunnanensis TaxID=152371 RepID=A0AAP0Q137_9MAGN
MLTWRHVGLHVKSPNYFEVMMWSQFNCSFGFDKSTPSLWAVSKSKPLAAADHLCYATAPPKPSIISVLRHCASPPAARRRISHSVSFLLTSGCSSSLRAPSRSSPSSSSVTASRLQLLAVAFDYATSGLLLGLSTSLRTPVASLPRGARLIARPFSSPALPSPLSCFRPIIPVEEIRSKGQEPYAYKWDRTHSANQLQDIYIRVWEIGRSRTHLRQERRQRRAYDAAKAVLMSGRMPKPTPTGSCLVELGKKNAQPPPAVDAIVAVIAAVTYATKFLCFETSQSDVANSS